MCVQTISLWQFDTAVYNGLLKKIIQLLNMDIFHSYVTDVLAKWHVYIDYSAIKNYDFP
jgi:hypothetical protein